MDEIHARANAVPSDSLPEKPLVLFNKPAVASLKNTSPMGQKDILRISVHGVLSAPVKNLAR
jgi:hypothetical protein